VTIHSLLRRKLTAACRKIATSYLPQLLTQAGAKKISPSADMKCGPPFSYICTYNTRLLVRPKTIVFGRPYVLLQMFY